MHERDEDISLKAKQVKHASRELARSNTNLKNQALLDIAEELHTNRTLRCFY
jgi:gamma-glutamyl phosphate reductase